MSYAMVTVAGNGLALEGVPVYVFSESGSYLGLSNKTDSEGQVLFRLAAGAYKFRADHQGSQYWAEMNLSADQVTPVEISTGGGRFTFTVLSGETDPLVEVKCYVFSDSGSYLGIYKKTDENGQVTLICPTDITNFVSTIWAIRIGVMFTPCRTPSRISILLPIMKSRSQSKGCMKPAHPLKA